MTPAALNFAVVVMCALMIIGPLGVIIIADLITATRDINSRIRAVQAGRGVKK